MACLLSRMFPMTSLRTLLIIALMSSVFHQGSAQLAVMLVADPDPGVATQPLKLTCSFTARPPTRNVTYVHFLSDVTGSFKDLYYFDAVTGVTNDYGNSFGGPIQGEFATDMLNYTITLPVIEMTDNGNYRCLTEDTSGNQPRRPPTIALSVIEPPDPCETNPCENGGNCTADGTTFQCACTAEYHGDLCSEDSCEPNPCENGGTCTPDGATFQCDCAPDYHGDSCNEHGEDVCESNPCQHGGTCSPDGDTFQCSCPSRYEGKRCEIKEKGLPVGVIVGVVVAVLALVIIIIVIVVCCRRKRKRKHITA